jgi:hypothetical protein
LPENLAAHIVAAMLTSARGQRKWELAAGIDVDAGGKWSDIPRNLTWIE